MHTCFRDRFFSEVCVCVCMCVFSLFIFVHLLVFVWFWGDWLRVLSWIKTWSYKTTDSTQPWRGWELFSFVDFHGNQPAHQRKLFKNPQEWQMCSTMGQMSGVWRAVHVFSKHPGITMVYRYNPLVTWNVKDNAKALMPCKKCLAKLPCKSRHSHTLWMSLVLILWKKNPKRWCGFYIP